MRCPNPNCQNGYVFRPKEGSKLSVVDICGDCSGSGHQSCCQGHEGQPECEVIPLRPTPAEEDPADGA